jgi:hypothetical protein
LTAFSRSVPAASGCSRLLGLESVPELSTAASENRPALPASAPAVCPPPARLSTVTPLAPERYKVQLTVGAETYGKLRRAQDLLRHAIPNGDPAAIFDRALTLLVAHLEKTKLAMTAAVPSSAHKGGARNAASSNSITWSHTPPAARRLSRTSNFAVALTTRMRPRRTSGCGRRLKDDREASRCVQDTRELGSDAYAMDGLTIGIDLAKHVFEVAQPHACATRIQGFAPESQVVPSDKEIEGCLSAAISERRRWQLPLRLQPHAQHALRRDGPPLGPILFT